MIYNFLTPIFLLSSLVLLLLSILSSPIIDTISFFRIHVSVPFRSTTPPFQISQVLKATVHFGFSGFCVTYVPENPPALGSPIGIYCENAGIGYPMEASVTLGTMPISVTADGWSQAYTRALVVNPIACAFVFIALFPSFFTIRSTPNSHSRLVSISLILTTVFAALVTTAAYITDAVVAEDVQSAVRPDSYFVADWGNAVWMVLGAMIAAWLAVITSWLSFRRWKRAREPNSDVDRY